MLEMTPFADPTAFDAVYAAIDTDGSQTIDRAEFVAYFLRRLAPDHPGAETAAERKVRLAGGAAAQFADAGRLHRERGRVPLERPRTSEPWYAPAARPLDPLPLYDPLLDPAPHHHYRLAASSHLSHPEMADVSMYDDVTRGLENAQRRRAGLQHDIQALQKELHAVEADIYSKGVTAQRIRDALSSHRKSHSSIAGQMDERVRRLDERARLAMRPDIARPSSDRLR